ncbi:MAG: RHS repeat-associated core domain-containing protein, partial [Parahaliea sp.]
MTDAGNGETRYTIENGSNRLIEVDGVANTYDANGNLLYDGRHRYRYDARNRLVAVDNGATANYQYNALGQRIHKTSSWRSALGADIDTRRSDSTSAIQPDVVSTTDTVFAYEGAKLLGEYDLLQKPYREIIWMGDIPVAVVQKGELYQIHSDHLATPVAITDSNNTIVWRWDRCPFGDTAANEDPDGDGRAFAFNLRLPGQYFDGETQLHYNYFRDYNPSLGRYIQSDPIGLEGGLNTYSYVDNNSLIYVDPTGEALL